MKMSFKLLPLFLCLSLFHSMAQASVLSQKEFEFLKPFNDTALVENGLKLTGSLAGISLSTLFNLGIWLGVCKIPEIVSGLSAKHNRNDVEKQELVTLKTDFCLQLAPVITIAEVALAGHVSPWPLEQSWWKPLYFAGAGMAAYYGSQSKNKMAVPIYVLTFLAAEAGSRTVASAASAAILRIMNITDISTEWYVYGEYMVLSVINGALAGAITCEAMKHKGFSTVKAALASAVSGAIGSTFSGVISMLVIGLDEQRTNVAVAVAVVVAVAVAGAAAAAAAGAGAGAGAVAVAAAAAVAGAGAGAVAGAGAGAAASASAVAVAVAGAGAAASALAGAAAGALLTLGSSKIVSNNPVIKAGVTLAPALTFAIVNSHSNYAVYSYPLEESLSKTAWVLWKKFYAPLNYLSTLFN